MTNDTKILAGRTVLVVEDERYLREALAEELLIAGAEVIEADSGSMAYDIVVENKVDVIISDWEMVEGGGLQLLDRMHSLQGPVPRMIFVTGYSDEIEKEAMSKGAAAVFPKPYSVEELIQSISQVALAA